MFDRRHFLQHSALVSVAPWIPSFLPGTLNAADAQKDDRILVVIQLDGGNDGLNTVIPFADENYVKSRRKLRIAEKSVLKLNDSIGLHPSMKDAADLFDDGQLTIVQGVGYPNPNRSHFESMSIWHHARVPSVQHDSIGWLGRAVDVAPPRRGTLADSVYVGSEAVPVALRGRRANAISLERESDLALQSQISTSASPVATDDLTTFVTRIQDQSFEAARHFDQSARKRGAESTYPTSALARHLQLISRLIKLEGGTRVFYASQAGYDTHVAQADSHRNLLREFSGAIKAFLNDLETSRLAERVVVLAFSEFGRRVQENGSGGTDHGVAGPVFLAGNAVEGGFVGQHPSLTDLDQGDMNMSIDFRRVYAAILQDWLRIEPDSVLGGTYAPLSFLNKA